MGEKRLIDKNGKTVGYTFDRGYGLEETVDENGQTIGYVHDYDKMCAEIEQKEKKHENLAVEDLLLKMTDYFAV